LSLEQFPVKWAHMQDNFGNAPADATV
jgi:hypothetical protein